MKVAIISHFDRHDLADDYFIYSLRCYRPNFDYIAVISTAKLDLDQQSRLLIYADKVIIRENLGYDFASWRVGFDSLDVRQCTEISFINDSFYGPVSNFRNFIDRGRSLTVDVWGASLSAQFAPHVQSFFMTFNERIIRSDFFRKFWLNVEVLHDKGEIIRLYEIGLSQTLLTEGFSIGGIVDMRSVTPTERRHAMLDNVRSDHTMDESQNRYFLEELGPNPMQLFWGHSLRAGVPFIKIELLRENPLRANLSAIFRYLEQQRWYEHGLIIRHLERIMPASTFASLSKMYALRADL